MISTQMKNISKQSLSVFIKFQKNYNSQIKILRTFTTARQLSKESREIATRLKSKSCMVTKIADTLNWSRVTTP